MSTHLDLTTLTDDGDTLELDGGRTLRLRIEVDQDSTINDYDSDGKVEWTRNNIYSGRTIRPDGFTGRARILSRDGNSTLWWEPYPDLSDDLIKAESGRILDLVTYGFKGVILELCEGTDAYGKPIVTDVRSLWGVDLSGEDNYLATVVADLADELGVTK